MISYLFVFVDCLVHISGPTGWLTIPVTSTDNSNRPSPYSSLFQKYSFSSFQKNLLYSEKYSGKT